MSEVRGLFKREPFRPLRQIFVVPSLRGIGATFRKHSNFEQLNAERILKIVQINIGSMAGWVISRRVAAGVLRGPSELVSLEISAALDAMPFFTFHHWIRNARSDNFLFRQKRQHCRSLKHIDCGMSCISRDRGRQAAVVYRNRYYNKI